VRWQRPLQGRTYPAALAARRSNVPVYVLVDTMKLHVGSLFGEALRLDPIRPTSLPRATTTDELAVRGHLFDRTPAALLTALITEKGIVHPSQAGTWMLACLQPNCRRNAEAEGSRASARRLNMVKHRTWQRWSSACAKMR